MNDKEQRIAIAKACGWKMENHPDTIAATKGFTMPQAFALNPSGELWSRYYTPDYLSDLNAMHEAEMTLNTLDAGAKDRYMRELQAVTVDWKNDPDDRYWLNRVASATAAQRAEAFLRTLYLWKD